jgi:hypothetical protein
MHGCCSSSGADTSMDRTQGPAPQVFPGEIIVFVAHVPPQFAGGSKLALTPLPHCAAELTVHVVGNEHEPMGSSHVHVWQGGGAGSSWPSKTRIGADSGHGGAPISAPS